MYVNEIFYSIEGEGKNFGIPTIFIRLQGCNLNPGCSWCDTAYARASFGKEMTIREIIQQVRALTPDSVLYESYHICVTGGEPLYQEDTGELVKAVHKENAYYIEMFTNGTLPPPSWYLSIDSFIVDIKCPSSKVSVPYCAHWFKMREKDQIKFVVADEIDLAFVDFVLNRYHSRPEVLISPMIPVRSAFAPSVGLKELEWAHRVVEYCKLHNYRFSWQQQKLLWGDKRGV